MTGVRCAGAILVLAAWALAGAVGWPDRALVPAPHEVAIALARALGTADGWRDLGATMARVVAGVSLATVAGAAVGFAFGHAHRTWRAAEPVLDLVRGVPPVLAFPLFLVGLGLGEGARVAAIAFGAFGIVALAVGDALARAPRARRDAVRLLGLPAAQTFLHLHVHEALPGLFLGVRVALATGLVVAIVTEMLLGARHGLGARALEAQLGYETPRLWAVVLLAAATGAALTAAVRVLERRLAGWSLRPDS